MASNKSTMWSMSKFHNLAHSWLGYYCEIILSWDLRIIEIGSSFDVCCLKTLGAEMDSIGCGVPIGLFEDLCREARAEEHHVGFKYRPMHPESFSLYFFVSRECGTNFKSRIGKLIARQINAEGCGCSCPEEALSNLPFVGYSYEGGPASPPKHDFYFSSRTLSREKAFEEESMSRFPDLCRESRMLATHSEFHCIRFRFGDGQGIVSISFMGVPREAFERIGDAAVGVNGPLAGLCREAGVRRISYIALGQSPGSPLGLKAYFTFKQLSHIQRELLKDLMRAIDPSLQVRGTGCERHLLEMLRTHGLPRTG